MSQRHVVLVGAGHAHIGVLRRFARQRLNAWITLVTPDPATPYSGMLPGVIAGLCPPDAAMIQVAPLAAAAGATLLLTEAVGLDVAGRRLLCRDGPPVPYDVLSLDIGAASNAPSGTIGVKPITGLLAAVAALERRLPAGGGHVAVVGAGAGGVELAFALAARLPATRFTLAGKLLPGFPPRFVARAAALLAARRIGRCANAAGVQADAVLWAAAAAPAEWLRATGLTLDAGGFIAVDAQLRATGHADIFAAGDVAGFAPRAIAKSGVNAVRAGSVLADNIRRSLSGRPLRAFRPPTRALVLLSTGTRHAIGARGGLVVSGHWVWRWKDWLDRRFVAG